MVEIKIGNILNCNEIIFLVNKGRSLFNAKSNSRWRDKRRNKI